MHTKTQKNNSTSSILSTKEINSSLRTKNRIFAFIFLLLIIYVIDTVFIHPRYRPNHHYLLHQNIHSHDNTHAYLQKIRDQQEKDQSSLLLPHDVKSEAGKFFLPNHNDAIRNFHPEKEKEKENHFSENNNVDTEYEKRKNFLIQQQHESALIQRSWESIKKIPSDKFDRCKKIFSKNGKRKTKIPERMDAFPEFTRSEKGVRPRFAVITLATSEMPEKMKLWSFVNKVQYCQKHGYDFIVESDPAVYQSQNHKHQPEQNTAGEDEEIEQQHKNEKDHHEKFLLTSTLSHWSKLKIIRRHLPKYEYVMWMDTDTLIMNFSLTITDLVDRIIPEEIVYQQEKQQKQNAKIYADFVLTKDMSGINTGVMFVKNSIFSRNFLKRLFHITDFKKIQPLPAEQGSMRYLLDDGEEVFFQKSSSVTSSSFNNNITKTANNNSISIFSHREQEISFGSAPIYPGVVAIDDAYYLAHRFDRLHKSREAKQFARYAQHHFLVIREDNFFNSIPAPFILHERHVKRFRFKNGDWVAHFPSCMKSYSHICLGWFEYYFGKSLCENPGTLLGPGSSVVVSNKKERKEKQIHDDDNIIKIEDDNEDEDDDNKNKKIKHDLIDEEKKQQKQKEELNSYLNYYEVLAPAFYFPPDFEIEKMENYRTDQDEKDIDEPFENGNVFLISSDEAAEDENDFKKVYGFEHLVGEEGKIISLLFRGIAFVVMCSFLIVLQRWFCDDDRGEEENLIVAITSKKLAL